MTHIAPRRSLRTYLSALLLLFVVTELAGAAYVYSRVAQLVLVDLAVYSGLLLVLLVATLVLYRAITKPLSELARSVRANATTDRPKQLAVSGPAEIAGVIHDINTLISTVAKQLADRESADVRANARLDASLDAIISIDEHGRVVEWNRQAEITFGWTRVEAMDKELAGLIIPERYRTRHAQGLAT